MFYRIIPAAALCLGLVLAADDADARSSGSAVSRPAVSAPRSLQRFQQAPAHHQASQGLHVTPHPHRRPFHRDFRHQRWPYAFFGAPWVIGDDGFLVAPSYEESAPVPPGQMVVIDRRTCFVQPHLVPSEETGAMREVTVTRCY
jgi:hypothetical protein